MENCFQSLRVAVHDTLHLSFEKLTRREVTMAADSMSLKGKGYANLKPVKPITAL